MSTRKSQLSKRGLHVQNDDIYGRAVVMNEIY